METAVESRISLAELWSIQESLLQSYRATFITAESVVFGLAATVASSSSWVLVALLMTLGVGLVLPWTRICGGRARSVSFVHWLMLREEEGMVEPQPFHAFKQFQDSGTYQGAPLDPDTTFKKLLRSRTRRWMEQVLPASFLGLWLLLALYVILLQRAP